MKILSSLALVIAAGWMSGCATAPDHQLVSVPLNATQDNAGHIAHASLVAMGSETQIRIAVSGVPDSTTLPARLYTYLYAGGCGALTGKPAYSMNDTVRSDLHGPGMELVKVAPLSLDSLRSGNYALVVRSSAADGNQDLFCAKVI
ncbi:hypothetical protein D3C76_1202150 [compost metagenome]|uniref:Lipoprotein n=1 Tax=Pseudomonas alkylphenolica TaxID=237609 RepID=A0A6I6H4B2_9PSED|nr:hypothetical protein [Pseudomonas alkylphenolica]QGW76951.1 hypothetical protein GPJ81_09775 [Pseudomonas alkylphenolica]